MTRHHDDEAYRGAGDEPTPGGEWPRVSLITVCFNSADTIRDTLESVRAQDYPNIEYIVVDGASTDGTLDILDAYRSDIDVLVSEPDRGLYDAINKGIRHATGDVVGLLNADDIFAASDSLSRLVEVKERSGVQAVFADVVFVKRDEPRRIVRHYDSSRFSPRKLAFGWMPAHPTLIVDRNVLTQVGGYSLSYEIASDFDMVVKLFHVAKVSHRYVGEVVVRMREGGISTASIKSVWVLNKEIVRACRAHGIRTHIALVLLKMPLKLLERLGPFVRTRLSSIR